MVKRHIYNGIKNSLKKFSGGFVLSGCAIAVKPRLQGILVRITYSS
jgi:hypothetical protein